MKLTTGLDLEVDLKNLQFIYHEGCYGPQCEKRRLDDIRGSLSNPDVEGPEYVYAVAMDVGNVKDRQDLIQRNLLYGAMIFEKGLVGKEPVRSQGHIHAVSASCHASTCEVYEIWKGEAYIYMQEWASKVPGRCVAIHAKQGDVVIVPPGWVHATINADITQPMLFGAWCVRDYGFAYDEIRARKGIAFFPEVVDGQVQFTKNPNYDCPELMVKEAKAYPAFHLRKGVPIYTQYEEQPDLFTFVTNPKVAEDLWETCV